MEIDKPRVALRPEDRKKIASATKLWGYLTLSGVVLLAALTIWHIIRRGRLLRSSLAPPRAVPPLQNPSTDMP
jgi:hypothetical protein